MSIQAPKLRSGRRGLKACCFWSGGYFAGRQSRGVPFPFMSKRLFALFITSAVTALLVVLNLLEKWTLVEHALEYLRKQGPIGEFVAGVLTSPITPLVLAFVAVSIGIDLWKERGRGLKAEETSSGKPQVAKPGAQIGDTVNSSAVATGGSVVQHYHFPSAPIAAAQAPAPSPPMTDAAYGPTKIEKSPNLQYAGSRERRVLVSPDPHRGICDPLTADEDDKSLKALVLKFENKTLPTAKIVWARNVIAKLRFQSEDGMTQKQVDYGVWLNSPCNSVGIGIGDTCELRIFCMVDGFLETFEDRRGDGNKWIPSGFSWFDSPKAVGLSLVDVTLIDQDTQHCLTVKLRVWHDGSSFCVAER